MRKVKCTNCGFEYEKNVENIHESGEAIAIRATTPAPPDYKTKKCVDLLCPNCKEEFEFCWEE